MNNEFKKSKNSQYTVYTLESATGGSTSVGNLAGGSSSMGGVRRRGDNLIAQEGDKDKVDASKPRNFVAKNAKMGGAGQHKDKKKAEKQGDIKHKNKSFDMAEGSLNEGKGLAGELAGVLKANGFKGPYRLGKLPKWAADLSEFDKNSLIMVQGNDVEYDQFVLDAGFGELYMGGEGGITKMTEKAIMNDIAYVSKGVAEAGNKPLEKSRFGTGDTRTPRDIKSQMQGASDEFVRSTADKKTGPFHSKVAKMQGKMAKSELRRREQGVAEGLMNKIANKVMGAAPEQPKYKVGQRVKYETSPHQPDWKDGGRGVGVITAYKNGHYMINGNPVNHFEIKGVVKQSVAEVAGPEKCWPGHRKVGTKPGTGKNAGKRVNDCEKIGEQDMSEDHEIQMASSELQAIAKNAVNLLDLVRKYSEQDGLQAWQQSKITKAADYLNSVLQSISGEQNNLEEGMSDYVGDAIEGVRMSNPGLDKEDFLDELYMYIENQYGQQAAEMMSSAGQDAYDEWYDSYSDMAEDHSDMGKGFGSNGYRTAQSQSIRPGAGHNMPVAEDEYMAELFNKLAEKIPANAPVDVWVKDFQKADPNKYHQFKNKTPEKKAQMAVAASYGAKNPSKKK